MTLVIKKPTTAKLVMRKGWQPMDSDAATYIAAVEAADGQALEEKVKIAIDNFVLGCKADGIWSAINASCILAGARTRQGALVALKGTYPVNNGFVDGDYTRKTGLGDASNTSKYLDSGVARNTISNTNHHFAVYTTITVGGVANQSFLGATVASNTYLLLRKLGVNTQIINYSTTGVGPSGQAIGLLGTARNNSSSEFSFRFNSITSSVTIASSTAATSTLTFPIFAFGDSSTVNSYTQYSQARIAFYSIGTFLDLQLLDTRVTDLINAFGAAIP